jgi:hypothetical protein
MMVQAIRKFPLIGLLSVFLFSLWAVLVVYLAPQYQNSAGTDPLAMIDVLFPSFWVVLGVFVGVCFYTFIQRGVPRWLHMLLLSQFALMLYYTPFLLSGFSWCPDSLWHGGVASYIPQILSGSQVAISDYAHAYPLLPISTYLVEQTFGVNIFDYSLYFYPVICTVLFAVLAYFFAYRMFGSKTAFLTMLFTLPTLHYIEMHVSPFSAGTIILLGALILSTYKSLLAVSLSILSFILLAIVHPISPLMLGVYFFSVFAVNLIFRRRNGEGAQSTYFFLPQLVLISAIWVAWTTYAMTIYIGVQTSVMNLLNFSFLSRLFVASEFTIGQGGFIYSWIQNLSLLIYGIIFVLIFSGRLPSIRTLRSFFKIKSVFLDFFKKVFSSLTVKRMSLALSAVIYAAGGFLFFLTSGERFLLGRGLLYFVLMGSMVIATYFVTEGSRFYRAKTYLALGLVVFLVCTFPVISYSKESYNTFTPSADAGLQFLSSRVDLSQNSVSMTSSQQLASYANLSEGLDLVRFPPNLANNEPDVIAMRINGFFLISMRNDLSFTDNGYTRLADRLEDGSDYSKVYSNSQFDVFLHSDS